MTDLNQEEAAGNVPLDDKEIFLKDRKDRLLQKFCEENNIRKALYEKLKALEKPKDYDNVEKETGEMVTNVKKLYADVEKLTRQEQLKYEEVIMTCQELEKLKKRRNELSQVKAEPSDHDKEILENCMTRIKLYEKLTGIHWIHDSSNISGYIGNKHNNYIKALSQDNVDNLWEEIGKAASADWSEFLPQHEEKHE